MKKKNIIQFQILMFKVFKNYKILGVKNDETQISSLPNSSENNIEIIENIKGKKNEEEDIKNNNINSEKNNFKS